MIFKEKIMMNIVKLYLLGLWMLSLPVFSIAAASSTEMSKDEWLEQVRTTTAKPICKSFIEDETIAMQMKAHHVSYEQCFTLIPAVAEQCAKKYTATLPQQFNDQDAEKWGKLIGECIGNDFVINYLSNDKGMTPKTDP